MKKLGVRISPSKFVGNLKYALKYYPRFIFVHISFVVVLLTSAALSILDFCHWQLCWKNMLELGVCCQIITALSFFVGSIIGIAIPLQKEDCLGIPYYEFNKLREKYRYSITFTIIVLVVLAALTGLFYFISAPFACIGLSIASVILCLNVCMDEIPLMMRNDNKLISIVRNRVNAQLKKALGVSKETIKVLEFLCIDYKNLKTTYELLKTHDQDCNKELLLTLLDIQTKKANELKIISDSDKRIKTAKALYSNVSEILNLQFDIANILKDEVDNAAHYLIRVVLSLMDVQTFSEQTLDLLASCLSPVKSLGREKNEKFLMSIVMPIVFSTVSHNDFRLAKELRKMFSEFYFELNENGSLSLLFSLMSLQFYYLSTSACNVSEKLKNEIFDFLTFEGLDGNAFVISWKKLLLRQIEWRFSIEFNDLSYYYDCYKDYWRLWIRNEGAHFETLTDELIVQWYLTCLILSCEVLDYDYNRMLSSQEKFRYALMTVADKLVEESGVVHLTETMKKMFKYYDLHWDETCAFNVIEAEKHQLFKFKNNLHIDELERNRTNCQGIDIENILNKYREIIECKISSEWGYDQSLPIDAVLRCKRILMDKNHIKNDYDYGLAHYIARNILQEVSASIECTIIPRDEQFDKAIELLLSEPIDSLSVGMDFTVTRYIMDERIKNCFADRTKTTQQFRSCILPPYCVIVGRPFKFNVNLNSLKGIDLTNDEAGKLCEEFKQGDGQYYYEGAYISREMMERTVNDRYFILEIEIMSQVNMRDTKIYKIDLFPTRKQTADHNNK